MRVEEQLSAGIRYTVIPRVLVFLTHGEQVLLLRGAPTKKLWAGKYNGLGGHVESGETPYQAALREVREEAGISDVTLTLRALVHITMPQPPGVMLFVFVGHTSQMDVLASEEGVPEWHPLASWHTLPLVEDLPELLPKVLTEGPLVFGHYVLNEEGLRITFN